MLHIVGARSNFLWTVSSPQGSEQFFVHPLHEYNTPYAGVQIPLCTARRSYMLAADISLLQGIEIQEQGPTISHLFFADNALFFFKASDAACTAMTTLLNCFYNISRQLLNLQKSFVKFSLII